MKILKYLTLFVSLLLFNISPAQDNKPRKKVAVVLSGGGAKGTAHIGALKVIEEAGIPIDMVVGTSMGALMGGLYCIGYTPEMLDSLVRVQDWNMLLSDRIDPMSQNIVQRDMQNTYILSFALNNIGKLSFAKPGFIKGKNLSNLFSKLTLGYHDSIDFNNLPIPFACVATDIADFKEIDFHSGNLATAMRASMSIPAVFTPVRTGDMILADGGLKNNFPADIAKEMGADIIIGVSVQNEKIKRPEYFNNTLAVVNQLIDASTENKFELNKELCDVFIKVNIEGYSAASFNPQAIDSLIRRGEEASREHLGELSALKEKIGLDEAEEVKKIKPYRMLNQKIRIKIREVNFTNIDRTDRYYLKNKFNLKQKGTTTIDSLEQVMTVLRSNLFYNDASYQVKYGRDGYKINIETEGKKAAEMYLGVRFDKEEEVSMQLSAIKPLNILVPTLVQTTLRLGKRSSFLLQSTFNPSNFFATKVAYKFFHQDLNIYYKGKRDFNPVYNQHQINLCFFNQSSNNFSSEVFLRWDYYRYGDLLFGKKSSNYYTPTSHTYSYNASIEYNDYITPYFASKGKKIKLKYSVYTDNFYKYNSHSPLQSFSAVIQESFPLKKGFVLIPAFYMRGIYGEDIPTVLQNCIGGQYFSHYTEQQMPFAGIRNMEIGENNFMALQLLLRKRLSDNNYISFTVNVGENERQFKKLFTHTPIYGLSLSYDYNSIIGPVGASLSYSDVTKSPYLFINIGYEF